MGIAAGFLAGSLWLVGLLGLTYSTDTAATEIRALTENLPPISYEVDGKVIGFASELLDLIVKESGNTVSKELLPWPRAYSMVQKQENTLIYSLVRTPERDPLFHWVGPISKRRIYLYKFSTRKDIDINSLDDARNFTIGTTHDSAATKNLIKQGFEIGKQLDIALDDEMNMKKFRARRFDLLLSLDWAAAYNTPRAGLTEGDLEPVLLLDSSLEYWYGMSLSTNPEIPKQLNAALQKVKRDGRYATLMKRYLPKVQHKLN